MPTPLTIRERIERRIHEMVSAGNFNVVERWDKDGNSAGHRDVIIVGGDEQASEGGVGATGITEVELSIAVVAYIARPENGRSTSATHNALLGELERLILADPEITDSVTGERIAVDTRKTGTFAPPIEEGQHEAVSILEVQVHYQHSRDDPYTAPGVSRLEV